MRVATDIGGTFTDLVYLDEDTGRVGVAKTDTTPPEFEQGVINAIKKAGLTETGINFFVHGTTVIINALTERKGAKTGLITTKGFRDVLELGRSNRADIYNVYYKKPVPFVPRYLRLEVEERINYKGEVLVPLKEDDVRRCIAQFKKEDVEAIGICFLHSYANPEHERRCAEIIRREWPEVDITVSHEISKEWREYERTSTAVLNSYVQPVAARYIDSLDRELNKLQVSNRRYIMQSNGGTTSFARAKEAPINMVESGPVAGVFGAATLGKLIGEKNIIALDIGGTTAKCSLIENGEMKVTTDYKIEWSRESAGYPIKIPVVDIIEIGAGGGSIAWIDDAGSLHVGPRSAGALPGPVAYGRGGTEPTVTDANLIAGRINPEYFLGGEIKVDLAGAREAMARIAAPFNLTIEDAALGVIRLANANMINALKLISVRRGYDPRDFTLVAFGGGGSMHAAALARELKIKRVLIPVATSVFSAWGMLMTDLRYDLIQTTIRRTNSITPVELHAIWDSLEKEAVRYFQQENLGTTDLVFSRFADMRYLGQEHTVKVPVPGGKLDAAAIKEIEERFHTLHEQHYTFRLEDSQIEFVNFHLTTFGRVKKPELARLQTGSADATRALKGHRPVHFDAEGWQESAIYERSLLGAGATITGPAVVEEPASSTLLFPGQKLTVDPYGNLIIETGV
ncbi:hydantoinase/oxoprolinase family protein [Neomoorella thermoacetica]|uniref:hydantoinase/oxoprolinase family protein n=1 Tax=Neomoorella thermoacetica TaxID=1525 RepID=UPI0008FB2824|nr:hydantoinase/oxoprolinase family protein [Moorella thermoacetica]OIQ62690.1 acetophenone carboxylase gamma subunit [Moorella thermoacetica]